MVDLGEVMTGFIDAPVMRAGEPKAGDWVIVYGQIKDQRPASGRDDEDIAVELFSIGEQYVVPVRRDRVFKVDPPKDIAARCPHLAEWRVDTDAEYLLKRCTSHLGHTGTHQARVRGALRTWDSNATVGYFEER